MKIGEVTKNGVLLLLADGIFTVSAGLWRVAHWLAALVKSVMALSRSVRAAQLSWRAFWAFETALAASAPLWEGAVTAASSLPLAPSSVEEALMRWLSWVALVPICWAAESTALRSVPLVVLMVVLLVLTGN